MVPFGETPRPKGIQKATREERSADENTPRATKDDDNCMPNHLLPESVDETSWDATESEF